MGKEEKLSFSFSSKKPNSSSSQSRRPRSSFTDDDSSSAAAAANPHFVTVFDPSQTLPTSAPSKPVIEPLPNSDFRKKMKSLLPHQQDEDHHLNPSQSQATTFVLDSNSSSGGPTDGISYGLTLRSNSTAAAGAGASEAPEPRREDLTLKRFHQDMEALPEDRGMSEFDEVSVEDFGAAILAGYGWKEGKGIGRNKDADTKVVQYDRRAGSQGLGYNPSANDAILKVKKGRDVTYVVNKAAENAPQVVRVVSGRYIGRKGEVLKRKEGSKVVLRLVEDGEEVRVDDEMVAELGSEAEEKCLRKLRELEISNRKERNKRKIDEDDKKDRDSEQRSDSGHKSPSDRKRESRDKSSLQWLTNHIRVRVISKDFKGGKWYLKKGEVVDVVGLTTCDLMMDGSRELVRVDQEILETALPKRGGSVLVLYGRHKGVYGNLVERDMEEETGVVRDADSHELVNVKLEQIAEYVGDPSYLGY